MEKKADDILKERQLSITDSRKKILSLFLHGTGALSHNDIEKKVGERFDRVTIYRTLQIFLEKGIVHSIPTADNSIQYALCRNECGSGHHHDNHVHFVCKHCGNTVCLEDVTVPAVKLPKGFSSSQVEMIVSGICKDCR
ncbi:MAG: transcriptional repressor [Bacteroidetes bacterium]|nr:transcriptional repressor [Bacteroidota bacterium]